MLRRGSDGTAEPGGGEKVRFRRRREKNQGLSHANLAIYFIVSIPWQAVSHLSRKATTALS
jgi:hypothetical protein